MIRSVHRWLGVCIAAWLLTAALSGALLLFKDDYRQWRYDALPEPATVPAADPAAISAILSGSDDTIATLGMPTQTMPAYHAYYKNGHEALFHPHTAEPIDSWDWTDTLPAFLFELHVHLLLGDTGKTVAGILGLLAVMNISTGTLLWLRQRQIFRLRFLWPRDLSRPRLLRGHAAQGAAFGFLLVPLILSGVAIVFAGPAQSLLNGLLGVNGSQRPVLASVESNSTVVDWVAVEQAARRAFPESALRFVTPPARPGQPVVLRLRNSGEWHPNGRSYLVVDPGTGEVLERIDATQSGRGPSVFDSLYPLHAGKTGWPGYRLLLVATALTLAAIATSGAYLLLSRPRRPRMLKEAHGFSN